MKHTQQTRMFETEDLPLFSGTTPAGHIETFDPPPASRQLQLLGTERPAWQLEIEARGQANKHLDTYRRSDGTDNAAWQSYCDCLDKLEKEVTP